RQKDFLCKIKELMKVENLKLWKIKSYLSTLMIVVG
ncbi:hypothetical protein J791_3662, partial [Acinetobacter baumannii 44895_8]